MATHIREVEDTNRDLIDVFYFCSAGCWRDSFEPERIGWTATSGGAAPCAANERDDDVYCAECGVLIASPIRDTPVVVNLIDRPPICPVTGAAEPRTEANR